MRSWQFIFTSNVAADLLTKTFFAFFIWESEQNLYPILLFGFAYFVFIPVGSLISGFLTDQVDAKTPLMIGSLLQALQIIIIITFVNSINLETITIIGIIGGFAEGLKATSMYSIDWGFRINERIKNLPKYYAETLFTQRLLNLVLPLGAAYIVSATGTYLHLFRATLAVISLQIFLTIIFRAPISRNKFELKNILKIPGTNKNKLILIRGVFIEGLSEGITLTVLPIIALVFVKSILNWGFLNTSLVLISVFLSFILSRVVTDSNSKAIYGIGALALAISSVFFINRFNLIVILTFLVLKAAMEVIKEISYNASLDKIMERDRHEYNLHSEYKFLVELVSNIARIIPLIILIYLNVDIFDDIAIRIAFVAIGVLPLLALSVLGRSVIFLENFKEEDFLPKRTSLNKNLPSLQDPESSS